mmetsp:Transcript_23457/g.54689  ORF Transcript_23457/g.54689 Transcript_23457/m.54689 type:complete len:343 (-) Transcript_23457:4618-5646(-)
MVVSVQFELPSEGDGVHTSDAKAESVVPLFKLQVNRSITHPLVVVSHGGEGVSFFCTPARDIHIEGYDKRVRCQGAGIPQASLSRYVAHGSKHRRCRGCGLGGTLRGQREVADSAWENPFIGQLVRAAEAADHARNDNCRHWCGVHLGILQDTINEDLGSSQGLVIDNGHIIGFLQLELVVEPHVLWLCRPQGQLQHLFAELQVDITLCCPIVVVSHCCKVGKLIQSYLEREDQLIRDSRCSIAETSISLIICHCCHHGTWRSCCNRGAPNGQCQVSDASRELASDDVVAATIIASNVAWYNGCRLRLLKSPCLDQGVPIEELCCASSGIIDNCQGVLLTIH